LGKYLFQKYFEIIEFSLYFRIKEIIVIEYFPLENIFLKEMTWNIRISFEHI
jgi:hypothetical protein